MKVKWNKLPLIWKKTLTFLLIVLTFATGTFLFLLGLVLSGSRDQIQGSPEIMIVLGCQVMDWGPSQSLADRLDCALDYFQENPEMIIIVSGGQGDNEPTTEAFAMAQYLMERGVAEEQIYQEGNSRNTHQNLSFTRTLMEKEGLSGDILVVSSGFHLQRAKLLWKRVGGDPAQLSLLAAPVTDVPACIYSHVRESFALVKSFFFDQGQVTT